MVINKIMKENCSTTKKHKFLFWEWEEAIEDHDWGYIGATERKCLKCKKTERYFGERYYNGVYIEDWRKKYDSK